MGLKSGRGRGGEEKILLSLLPASPLPPPLPLSLFRCFSRWRPRSMYLQVFVKKPLLCRLEPRVLPYCAIPLLLNAYTQQLEILATSLVLNDLSMV